MNNDPKNTPKSYFSIFKPGIIVGMQTQKIVYLLRYSDETSLDMKERVLENFMIIISIKIRTTILC